MNNFPEQLLFSSGEKRNIDNTRLLLALREPNAEEAINNRLEGTDFLLEGKNDYTNSKEAKPVAMRINHTEKRFWVHSRSDKPIDDESLNALRERFRENLEWIGPVYQPKEKGARGSFCPLPNVLIILPAKETNSAFSQRLVEFGMKEVAEKSKYLGRHRYCILTNTENENAYQLKDRLKKKPICSGNSI